VLAIIFIIGAIVGVMFLAAGYQAIGTWRDRRRYPPPGRIINGLHIWRSGETGPSVVLESGIAGTSLSWKPVQDRVSAFARVCSYDRAGLGWSDPTRAPRSVDNIVSELRELLRDAAIPAPYILVGHSFGGLVVRHFAALHPSDVAGVVLVDPVAISDWAPLTPAQKHRLGRGVKLSRRGALLAQFGVVRLALSLLMSGSQKVPNLLARLTAGKGAGVTNNLTREVRKLPKEVWPMVAAQWCRPKSFRGMADYLEALPANAAAARSPDSVPAVIITALHGTPEQLPGAIHRTAFQTGHWIQLDEPDLVVNAIRDVIALTCTPPGQLRPHHL
jgi:pimeloyl-ACP methyl ester carboxylesterase